MKTNEIFKNEVSGKFVHIAGERFYGIENVDNMAPFFISVVSDSDHWLFVSSNGGLTAGRVSPDNALFPYVTVDRIHESDPHTGCKTLFRVTDGNKVSNWEPFNQAHDHINKTSRNLYKNILGNKLCFEEINHDLQLVYRYTWKTSAEFGFVRECELENLSNKPLEIEVLDGFQNILPAGTPRFTQTNYSNLVDAYKWTELDQKSGLAFYTLYSGITDRAEPCESLKTNTVFCLGFEQSNILLSSEQLNDFRLGCALNPESHKRGIRGAFLVHANFTLSATDNKTWQFVADIEQSQNQSVALANKMSDKDQLVIDIQASIDSGSEQLSRIMASADGFQITAEENVSVHHYANVQFNVLRGGAFDDHYQISSKDFSNTINLFNSDVYMRHQEFFRNLPEKLDKNELMEKVRAEDDHQLIRLCYEYLPIFFGRRHGDPSRPWNQFSIKLTDDNNNRLLTYQGNWRDIFQNWEALTFSYPMFVENVIAKFVNASTIDGYNPYRVTKEGIDWEVEEPDDPWSYIGYWGDHQIIYLQKMLELSNQFYPQRLSELLRQPIFSYANVPYRIKPFSDLLKNAKDTVEFDEKLAEEIERRVNDIGADGKLLLDDNNEVYQVNLLEKLLVPLLSKLGNLVLDGGIWLNTQRPEWNDANNALVGQGISMVTLYYLRRYVAFLQKLLANESETTVVSVEVNQWIVATAAALSKVGSLLNKGPLTEAERFNCLSELGNAASQYRQQVYNQSCFSGKMVQPMDQVKTLLADAFAAIEHTISTNERKDGLYNAYNLLALRDTSVQVDELYPMLEGQVAALSSGAFDSKKVVSILESLFASDVYREDQDTFMLYPDRKLPSFLQKNCVPSDKVQNIALLMQMINEHDERIITQDVQGTYRFNPDITNADELTAQLNQLASVYGDPLEMAREPLLALYEQVFNHQEFTGRSGGMFGFEGLGCIYWHMVAKLLLAAQESFFVSLEENDNEQTRQRIGQLYYRVREGLGFNKTPTEYGAFPTDPYSHTPKHAGAQQPGMTGQVKEEILARFGELGLRVNNAKVHFQPRLLRTKEFISDQQTFKYLNVHDDWNELVIPRSGLAFTWCQVPIIYQLDNSSQPSLIVTYQNGHQHISNTLVLNAQDSANLFSRNGQIKQIELVLNSDQLFVE